jgi:hypothetical protein
MLALRTANPAPIPFAPMPRMVPFGPRFAAAPRPYVPPPLPPRPASLGAEGPRLGEFSWGRLPTSILFMTGGVAGLYIGGAFPSPADVIMKAVGVAAVGWGVYYLFNEPATVTAAKPGGAQEPQKTPSPAAFPTIRGNIISPTSGTKPNRNFWSNSFDAQIAWYNGSPEDVNFTYDIFATIYGTGFQVEGKNRISKSLYNGTVKLLAGHDSGPLTITVPIEQPPEPGLTGYGLPSPTFKMEIQLRKFDREGNPIATGDPVTVGPFDYYA